MKKLIISALLVNLLFAADTLTGDTKLSCEAILCLSSGDRPAECNESINRYFSIHKKKWKDTVRARRNFLQLCPTGGDTDATFVNLRDNVLANLSDPCAAENLNSNIDRKNVAGISMYRVSPKVSSACQSLIRNEYTNINPRYTCDQDAWYSQEDWNNGYTSVGGKKVVIKKDCWEIAN
jgi:hypothetical protein